MSVDARPAPERPVPVRVPIPRRLYADLERTAARSQTTVGQWLVELADAYLAGDRCQHGARPPDPPKDAA